MKGVPIKFRAKGIDGKVYFGSIRKYINCYAILGKTSGGVSSDGFVEVFEDSICQLCGYDVNDNEIYEGDILINISGIEFKASLKGLIINVNNPCYRRYLENLGSRKQDYRLKEKNND